MCRVHVCYTLVCVCVCAHQKRPMEAGKLQTKCAVYTVVFVRDSSSSSFFYTMADLLWVGNGEKGGKKGQKIAIGFETRRNKTTVVFSWKKKKWLCSRKGRYHRCTYCTRLGAGIFRPRNEADAANQSSNAFFFVCFLLVLR